MSDQIWSFNPEKNTIKETLKHNNILKQSLRIISFGYKNKIQPLLLPEEDFFHN